METIVKYLVLNKRILFYITISAVFSIPFFITFPKFSGKLNGFDIEQSSFFKTSRTIDSLFGNKNKVILIVKPRDHGRLSVLKECEEIAKEITILFPETSVIGPQTFFHKAPEHFNAKNKSFFEFLKISKKVPVLSDLVSKDMRSFLIIIDFKNNTHPEINKLDQIVQQKRTEIYSIGVFSIFHLEQSIERYIRTDCVRLMFLILLFFITYYIYIFRKFSAIVYTGVVVSISIFCSLFFFTIFEFNVTLISVLVIPVVLVLSLSDSLHLITGYIEYNKISDKNDRLSIVLKRYIVPSFFSSATTAAAFFSFYIFNRSEYIREFGLVTATSLMLEFFLSFMISPFLLSFITIKNVRERRIVLLTNFLERNKQYFAYLFLLLFVCSIFLAPKLSFKTNSELFFPIGSDIKKTHDEFSKNYYSQMNLEIIIGDKNRYKINDSEELRNYIKLLTIKFRKEKRVASVTSAIDTFYFKSNLAGRVNIFDEFGDQNPYYNAEKNLYRLNVRFHSAELASDFIEHRLKDLLIECPSNIEIKYTSPVILMNEVNSSVSSSLVNSLLTSGFAIFILIFLMTRSLTLSLLSLIPNLVPLSFVVVLYYLFGMHINILTAITAVVCLGLLDDDTIHILYRRLWLKEELGELSISILSSAFLLVVGFGLFCTSSFLPTRVFGWVSALVFLFGLICEITLMQWLIDTWKKYRGNNTYEQGE